VAILSPLSIVMANVSLIWGIFYMCSLLIIATWTLRLRLADFRKLRF
jgi:hypothetical protein